MITFLFSRELATEEKQPKRKTDGAGFLRVLKELVTNQYWVEYVVALLSITISNVVIMGSAVYYAQFILGDAYSYASLSTALYIAMFLGVIATSIFIKKIGKRNTVIIGIVIMMLGTVLSGLLPQTVGNATVTLAIRGFGVGFPSALGAAMLQDTLTYGKWKSGIDMVGMGNAASSFCMKIGGGLGTAIIGWALALGGLDATQAVQGAGVERAIMVTFIWLPLVFMAVALMCFIAYRLDQKYSGYLSDLSMGKYGPNATVPESKPAAPEE
ncbi:Isoprimeverose transporter [bioreactor metagenome]|uniref:Isoprimeverose transporter n=1 Tax=bioreactor metagenome TaxID=1076179 RepID=A0A645CMZ7_9ZZZZ